MMAESMVEMLEYKSLTVEMLAVLLVVPKAPMLVVQMVPSMAQMLVDLLVHLMVGWMVGLKAQMLDE